MSTSAEAGPPEAGPPPETAINVLIVEDHAVVAEGLVALLAEHPDLRVLGWAPTVADATQLAAESPVDVAVVDFWLPDGTGVDAAAGIRTSRPDAVVVFVSADDSDQAMLAAVEAGASGYLVKTATGKEIVEAVRRAADGEMLIPAPRLAELLARNREWTRPYGARETRRTIEPGSHRQGCVGPAGGVGVRPRRRGSGRPAPRGGPRGPHLRRPVAAAGLPG